jgi:hypothetical protein
MSENSDAAMSGLHQLFPECARDYREYLRASNKIAKVLDDWREQQLLRFIDLLRENADDLEVGYTEERITKLAWAARNLLELSIWVDYCNLSDTHAKRFRDDSARDLLGFAKTSKFLYLQAQRPILDFNTSMQEIADLAQQMFGVGSLDDDFKRVSDAAQEVGRRPKFLALNKLFSKFAHPTAIAMNFIVPGEAHGAIRDMFLANGVRSAVETLRTIREVMLIHFPLPSK